MKDQERNFFIEVCEKCSNHGEGRTDMDVTPRDLIEAYGLTLPYKRAWYFLGKWAQKGWYEYGVTIDLGWITEMGNDFYKSLIFTR